MTLTVEYSEMTAKSVEHFKCVCVRAHARVCALLPCTNLISSGSLALIRNKPCRCHTRLYLATLPV